MNQGGIVNDKETEYLIRRHRITSYNVCYTKLLRKTPREDVATPIWRAKITAAEFLYGVTWATVAFISPETQGEAAHTFIFASLLVVISMRMLFASVITSYSIHYTKLYDVCLRNERQHAASPWGLPMRDAGSIDRMRPPRLWRPPHQLPRPGVPRQAGR